MNGSESSRADRVGTNMSKRQYAINRWILALSFICMSIYCQASINTSTIPDKASILTNDKITQIKVTASSDGGPGLTPDKMTDGDLNTRWSSEFKDNQWVIFDFGKPIELYAIEIFWEVAYAKEYAILASLDTKNWKQIKHINSNGIILHDLFTISTDTFKSARYIKLDLLKKGTEWGFSIYEIKFVPMSEMEQYETERFLNNLQGFIKIFSGAGDFNSVGILLEDTADKYSETNPNIEAVNIYLNAAENYKKSERTKREYRCYVKASALLIDLKRYDDIKIVIDKMQGIPDEYIRQESKAFRGYLAQARYKELRKQLADIIIKISEPKEK
ncbi:MAG: discoidin domain-containing protein [Elusimicrobiota bacterium]